MLLVMLLNTVTNRTQQQSISTTSKVGHGTSGLDAFSGCCLLILLYKLFSFVMTEKL